MTTKEEFWDRKRKLNDDFFVMGSVANPATEEQITKYEESTGFTFSEDIKDFLTTFGSLLLKLKKKYGNGRKNLMFCQAGNSDTASLCMVFPRMRKCLHGWVLKKNMPKPLNIKKTTGTIIL
jgi:hypothetical protein